ncbi:hypothetical protein [Breznakiella homolactica]|uniref:Uncharacterized protein n=1 Tax=Breznakiella homolactica TaxID=2798577 RepID=A0A7T7XK33_9SPIR|nr:hypothetical protein [Breznakiella homolactica]QQO07657.1 hypothetical protein JFL75_11945 [Breznakiella homolactica]
MKYCINNLIDYGAVNILINEDFNINKYKDDESMVVIKGTGVSLKNISKIGVELLRKTDSSYYGLLGFEYYPHNNNELIVMICYVEKLFEIYDENMLGNNEKIFVGLTSEYVRGIKNSIEKIKNDMNLFSGKIVINVAAQSLIGTSPHIYSKILYILLRIAKNDKEEYRNNELQDIIINQHLMD